MRFLSGGQAIAPVVATMVLITTPLSCSMQRVRTMARDIPGEINGWVAQPPVRQYDRKTLFMYIDGGAELYLAYRFRKAYVHTYTRAGEPDIIMDIYDMSISEDAFGVFTAEREGDEVGIGMGSEYEAGLLRFCKGRFFVSIMTHEETMQSRKAVLSLARAVAHAIHPMGDRPALLTLLPGKGLMERSIRYFHDHPILNLTYYIADENILHLGSHTEAVLGRYSGEEGEPYVLLVKYPSRAQARAALESFLHAYMPDATEPGIVETENGKWTAAEACFRFVVVVLEAPSEEWARSLLGAVRARLGARP